MFFVGAHIWFKFIYTDLGIISMFSSHETWCYSISFVIGYFLLSYNVAAKYILAVAGILAASNVGHVIALLFGYLASAKTIEGQINYVDWLWMACPSIIMTGIGFGRASIQQTVGALALTILAFILMPIGKARLGQFHKTIALYGHQAQLHGHIMESIYVIWKQPRDFSTPFALQFMIDPIMQVYAAFAFRDVVKPRDFYIMLLVGLGHLPNIWLQNYYQVTIHPLNQAYTILDTLQLIYSSVVISSKVSPRILNIVNILVFVQIMYSLLYNLVGFREYMCNK